MISLYVRSVDSTTSSGRSSKSCKEPDLAIEFKYKAGKTVCEVGIGEVTSHAQKGQKKKNAKDTTLLFSIKNGLTVGECDESVDSNTGRQEATESERTISSISSPGKR